MPYCLTAARHEQASDFVSRFDPRFWTVNFPRPAMAAVTTPIALGAADALRVDAVFYNAGDLIGLIWEAVDRFDHPLLAYETSRDFRGCRLSFRWRSGGVVPLDAIDGAVLTVEGRDETGEAFTAYVRLWNYAAGTGEDAAISLDFADVRYGFGSGGPPVWMGDVDRLFVSLAPPGYVPGSAAALASPAEGWAELTNIVCDGPGAVLAIGDVVVPPHGLCIANGYDDSYHLTPARLLRNVLQLGYRGAIDHYVGMSHYFRLSAGSATAVGGALNVACAAWHRDFAARARQLGFDVIWSLSFELLDQHCPAAWKQRAADGSAAQTGYTPPSALLSPANATAMGYLQTVAAAFMAITIAAELPPKFQAGEPWWWTRDDGSPCLYDASAVAAFAPVAIPDVRGTLSGAQLATLDAAGACLAGATAALVSAVKIAAPGCVTHLLAYLPTVLDLAARELRRANLPLGWAYPAFDVLQVEDYDWAATGDVAASATGLAAIKARLSYPAARQHYLSGFVASPGDAAEWRAIVDAAERARARGVAAVFLWALPQVLRDGLIYWAGDDEMDAFDDVLFPLALGRAAEVAPAFSTAIVAGSGGAEQRQANWAAARTRYDVGPGVRSEADIQTLLAFFRARMGPARAFRLRDPFDANATDELLGTGNGATRRFALQRWYGAMTRRITRPVAGSVSVKVAGTATTAFAVEAGGFVLLDAAPAAGAAVTASFGFDVPVRFADDLLTVSRATYLAGEAASVPLVEVREG
ncbi:DUF2460 domain-containing protein [Sphingomonas sp.]|uniref:DUF2460 domain-containing protein n=1 Tax=Sphingomonas sp. TaxID=28214 RepID=UPI003CC5C0A0